MKYLKVLLLAVITVITFGSAEAQVVVRAQVGGPVHRHYYHRRPGVVERRAVVVEHRPVVYRRHYYRRHHRPHIYR
jgi:hypothetical protein